MTVKIADQDLPISFGFGAIMEYEEATGTPVITLLRAFEAGDPGFTDVIRLICAGLNNGARKNNLSPNYSLQQVADMLDDSDNAMKIVGECMQLLANSFAAPDAKKKTPALAANRAERRKAS